MVIVVQLHCARPQDVVSTQMRVIRSLCGDSSLSITYDPSSIPNTGSVMICGKIAGMTQFPKSRPWYDGKRWLISLPAISKPEAPLYTSTIAEFTRAVSMFVHLVKDRTLDVPSLEFNSGVSVKYAKTIVDKSKSSDHVLWLDIETTGFNPIKDTFVCIGIKIGIDNSPVEVVHGHSNVCELMLYIAETRVRVGAVNSKFEQQWCLHYTGKTMNVTEDAQIRTALLFEEHPKGLEHIAGLVGCFGYDVEMDDFLYPIRSDKPTRMKEGGRNLTRHHHEAPMPLLHKYNAADVEVSYRGNRALTTLMAKEAGDPETVYKWLVRGHDCLARIELRGLHVDPERMKEVNLQYRRSMSICERRMRRRASEFGMDDINFNSTPQLQELMYDKLKLPVMMLTNNRWVRADLYYDGWWHGQGQPSTSTQTINFIKERLNIEGTPDQTYFVENLAEYTRISSMYSGALGNCIKATQDSDNFMRSNFSLTKLVTGQLSSTNPPVQNIPHDILRTAFTSRFNGGHMMEIDYGQLHLRIIGNLAQCEGFISAYNSNIDLHSRTAAGTVLRVDESKFLKDMANRDPLASEARDVGKRVNFSIIFEIGPSALSLRVGRPDTECKQIIKRWYEQYPEIKEQIERQHQYATRHGYVISPFGRVRHLPRVRSKDRYTRQRALRQAGDFLISNSGRYITLYAMILLDEMMVRRNMKSMVVSQVHDSIIIDVHPDEHDLVVELTRYCMLEYMSEYTGDWMNPIPLAADGFYGPSWYKGEKLGDIEL